ncbi:hypothetical protein V1477_019798 [Vespula maculifrons]|uniref:Uncharacterized protein n=1 Tax=Vespula maculifrons TaxID=7453 RepID=A0ABD2ARG4_VESMC
MIQPRDRTRRTVRSFLKESRFEMIDRKERAQSRDGVGDTTRHKSSETLDVTVASTIRRIPRDNFGKRKMTMPYAANRQTSQKPMCFTLIRTFMIRLGAII